MKTTQQLYGLDPKQFNGMLYIEVLALKRTEMERRKTDAHVEAFKIGFSNLSIADKARIAELDVVTKEAEKALKYIRLWQDEML